MIADAIRIERFDDVTSALFIDDNGDGVDETVSEFVINGNVASSFVDTNWSNAVGQGKFGDVTFISRGGGEQSATWQFDNIPSGNYQVSATWSAQENRATDAPFNIYNGSVSFANRVGLVDVNQELAPDDFTDGGVAFENLGIFSISGNTLTVQLTNDANEFVIADMVRISLVSGNTLKLAPEVLDAHTVLSDSDNVLTLNVGPADETLNITTSDGFIRVFNGNEELQTGFIGSSERLIVNGDDSVNSLRFALSDLSVTQLESIVINGFGSNDLINMASVDDDFSGDVIINGNDGDDVILGSLVEVPLTIRGGSGDDSIIGGRGNDLIDGGAGDDRIDARAGDDEARGDDGNDKINGGLGNDTIGGGSGNDDLNGQAGDDLIIGDDGDDLLAGGAGNDRLEGGDAADRLRGGLGDDILIGGNGADSLYGGHGNDQSSAGANDDLVVDHSGQNTLLGGDGNDIIIGGSGSDRIAGQAGDDILIGGDADDTLVGGLGDDVLLGGENSDVLVGQAGADLNLGGPGADTIVADDSDHVDVQAEVDSSFELVADWIDAVI